MVKKLYFINNCKQNKNQKQLLYWMIKYLKKDGLVMIFIENLNLL